MSSRLYFILGILVFLFLAEPWDNDVHAESPVHTKELVDTSKMKELMSGASRMKDSILKGYSDIHLREEILKWLLAKKGFDEISLEFSYPERGGKYDKRKIAQIYIRVLEPFGTELFNPGLTPTRIDKMLNSIHPSTKEGRIREQLLFKEGDELSGELLAQTTYLLRQKASIYDAYIWVRADDVDSSAVRLDVIVKDIFPIGGSVNISAEKVGIGLFNKNILGYDQVFSWNGYYYNAEHTLGVDLKYAVPNILGSFCDFDSRFYRNIENRSQHIEIRRSLNKKLNWIGGTQVDWGKTLKRELRLDSLLWINKKNWGAWLGYGHRSEHGATSLWMISYLNDQPRKLDPLFFGWYMYESRSSLLFSWSYFHEQYVRQNYIYRFGSNEDIPLGFGLYGTLGWEKSIEGDRVYMEATWQYAKLMFGGAGRIKLDGNIFYHPQKHEWQQALVQSVVSVVSPLYRRGDHRLRFLSEINYVLGISRLPEEFLRFSDDKRVRGVDMGTDLGNQRLLFFNEVDWHLPYRVVGFKIMSFATADIGWIGDNALFSTKPQIALGVGGKIRNDHTLFNTIRVSLSYYPSLSPGSEGRVLQLSRKEFSTFAQFYPDPPSVFEYK